MHPALRRVRSRAAISVRWSRRHGSAPERFWLVADRSLFSGFRCPLV